MRKRLFWVLCVLTCICCGAALAAVGTTEYSLGSVYARLSLSDSYIVLKQDNLAQHPELLASRNTTEAEVSAWIERIRRIHPHTVMLYPIDRETPARKLVKVGPDVLEPIAEKVRALGITAKIY